MNEIEFEEVDLTQVEEEEVESVHYNVDTSDYESEESEESDADQPSYQGPGLHIENFLAF